MTFVKLFYQFIHPLNSLTSKSAMISKLLGHTHGHHYLSNLDAFSIPSHQMKMLAGFQNSDLTNFTTPLKEK